MQTLRKAQAGFTLVEIIVVAALIAIIASVIMYGFSNYAGFQQYNSAVSDVSFLLKQSNMRARSAEGDSSYGVKFTSNSLTQFVGDAYSAADPDNETTTYELITFNLELTGGTDEIIFNKLTGLPSATGTIEVNGVHFTASTTIEVTEAGVIQ